MRRINSVPFALAWSLAVVWRVTSGGPLWPDRAGLVTAAAFIPAAESLPPPAPPLDPARLASAVLQGAAELRLPADAPGEAFTPEELAWGTIDSDPRAEGLWLALSVAPSPVARLYALRGLAAADPIRAVDLADALRQESARITVRQGGMVQVVSMARAVTRAEAPYRAPPQTVEP